MIRITLDEAAAKRLASHLTHRHAGEGRDHLEMAMPSDAG
jgi:hypothetical protein